MNRKTLSLSLSMINTTPAPAPVVKYCFWRAQSNSMLAQLEQLCAKLDGQKVPVYGRVVWPSQEGIGGA